MQKPKGALEIRSKRSPWIGWRSKVSSSIQGTQILLAHFNCGFLLFVCASLEERCSCIRRTAFWAKDWRFIANIANWQQRKKSVAKCKEPAQTVTGGTNRNNRKKWISKVHCQYCLWNVSIQLSQIGLMFEGLQRAWCGLYLGQNRQPNNWMVACRRNMVCSSLRTTFLCLRLCDLFWPTNLFAHVSKHCHFTLRRSLRSM